MFFDIHTLRQWEKEHEVGLSVRWEGSGEKSWGKAKNLVKIYKKINNKKHLKGSEISILQWKNISGNQKLGII